MSRKDPGLLLKAAAIAVERGGFLLNTDHPYKGVMDVYEFECKKQHRWKTKLLNIIYRNTWCPKCSNRVPITLEDLQAAAKAKGGVCLATEFINRGTRCWWRCAEGHDWFTTPGTILYNDSWCTHCSGNINKSWEHANAMAVARGGTCVWAKTETVRTWRWRCGVGHEWETIGLTIHKMWCGACAKRLRVPLEVYQEIAIPMGGAH
jgi:hypothetical protein